ncbi:hypothetical protein [Vibrio metschnikovii]|uniref:hypothetical protein n=1 Tax=Vibrio metschnikovii TaxID=28172 RepID=UPI001C2FA6EA|nr:hypothetical protein [Vibrio metschnikovii]
MHLKLLTAGLLCLLCVSTKAEANWVFGLNSDLIDETTNLGGYTAIRGVSAERWYIELGGLAQRLPRKNQQNAQTRYFMSVRIGKDMPISPYIGIGINPLQLIFDQLINDEENYRFDMHGQLGLSLQTTDTLRLDLYGAFYAIDKYQSFREVNTQYYHGLGLRLNLLF